MGASSEERRQETRCCGFGDNGEDVWRRVGGGEGHDVGAQQATPGPCAWKTVWRLALWRCGWWLVAGGWCSRGYEANADPA